MIVMKTPKGWTGPKEVDGLPVEGTWRAHQVPLAEVRTNPQHLAMLEEWMRSYRPEELFDETGAVIPEITALAPEGEARMSANPHTNGGLMVKDLELPDFRDYAVAVSAPAATSSEATRVLGDWLRDVMRANPDRFRLMGPDETASNRLSAVFEATDRVWEAEFLPTDDHLSRDGRVMEVLSEHLCQGWLEGYVLTGRHGLFNCYEAFIHIIDSMFNQHAKWLKVTRHIPWRRPLPSLNYLLSSHVWRQDNNGFSHQDPGFIDHVVNKKAEIIRVYLPPDANCLLSVADHCLRSRHYVNVIVAGKQPALNYLTMDQAIAHCTRGIGIWEWASNDAGQEPDVVMGCAGDIPTLETVAAVSILRKRVPELRVRVVNVVDLMRLEPDTEHPHGLSDHEFDALFTASRPVIFAYHGYPTLIHRLTYNRNNHANFHVRGYMEEGTTTTPFDMVMLNNLDRFHLVMDVVDRVPGLGERCAHLRQDMSDARLEARAYTREVGDDIPVVRDWTWAGAGARPAVPALPRTPRRTSRPRSCGCSSSTPARAVSSCRSSDLGMRRWLLRSFPRRGRWSTTMSCAPLLGTAVSAKPTRSGTGSSTEARGSCRRWWSTPTCGTRSGNWSTWRRSISRSRWPRSTRCRGRSRGCRRWRASTRHSTPRCRTRRLRTRCPRIGVRDGGFGGTGSMGCRTRGSRGGRLRWWGRLVLRRACGSSAATWEPGRRCARSWVGGRWTRRWVSRRSRGW